MRSRGEEDEEEGGKTNFIIILKQTNFVKIFNKKKDEPEQYKLNMGAQLHINSKKRPSLGFSNLIYLCNISNKYIKMYDLSFKSIVNQTPKKKKNY